MPPKLLEDAHVQRILRNVKSGVRDGRDITDLIGDREARVALELKLSRQIHHLRKRLAQAVAYLDGLAGEAQKTASSAWEKQTPCEVCGAPATGNRAEQNPKGGHQLVTDHPDGTKCRKTLGGF